MSHPAPLTAAPVIAFPRAPQAQGLLRGPEPEVLGRIGAPGIAAAIWDRPRAPGFADWIEALPPDHLPDLRMILPAPAARDAVHLACDRAGMAPGPFRDMLAGDVAALATIMGRVMGAPLLHLRLNPVATDACRRFHLDNLTARLLCTYRGTGTQLARPGHEDRPEILAPGAALILRGGLWPGPERTALLHRSPPVAGTGQVRLLLAIDPADPGLG